jgi:hypothetical protein
MTNLPDVTFNILDGQLGQVPSSVANASVKIGVCSDGTVGTIYSFGDTSTLSTLGVGPLVEALGDTLSVAGGTQYGLPVNVTNSNYGTAGSVTHTGTGSGTVSATFAPKSAIAMKVSAGGTLGTATVQFSINGGAYGSPVATTTGPWSYAIPGTLTTVTVAAGTYVLNDVYTIATDGSVSLSGSGPAASNVTQASSPMDVYDVLVSITTAGAVGTAVFTYSVDGGNITSAQIATAAKYAIPGTGVVLNFGSTFTAGDTYAFSTTAASYTNGDLTTALATTLNSAIEFGFVHVVGQGANSAAAAATAAVVDAAMTTAETAYRFIFALMGCPTSEGDSTVAAAFNSFSSKRVAVCAGDVRHISSLTGRIERRNCAFVVASRISAVPAAEDIGYVGSSKGSIPHIDPTNGNGLYRDESKTPLLDAARFITMRTFAGRPGYYITTGRTMAPGGSDFTYLTNRRVMDAACRIARQALLKYVNSSVRVNSDGSIDERDAKVLENDVNGQIQAALLAYSPPQISASSVIVNRSANILSSGIEPVSIRITPLGYARQIATSIGLNNPALVS